MKNGISVFLFAITLFFLAACGDDAISDDGMSIEEILTESIAAMESLESYSMKIDMEQNMDLGEDGEMSFDSSGEISLTIDPLAFKQSTVMDMSSLGTGEELDMEYLSYYSEEHGFFMEDPLANEWAKLPESYMTEMLAMSDMQLSPEDRLKPFQDYISELSVDETDSAYVITLIGDGLDMEELLAQMGGFASDSVDPMLSDMMNDIDVEFLEYEIFIDKDTFFQTEANINMKMTMNLLGQSIITEQTSHMLFFDFNKLGPIEIPQEILDNATEMSEEDMMGGN